MLPANFHCYTSSCQVQLRWTWGLGAISSMEPPWSHFPLWGLLLNPSALPVVTAEGGTCLLSPLLFPQTFWGLRGLLCTPHSCVTQESAQCGDSEFVLNIQEKLQDGALHKYASTDTRSELSSIFEALGREKGSERLMICKQLSHGFIQIDQARIKSLHAN